MLDWFTGSACAGLLLGLAELLVAAPFVRLPPTLGLSLVWSCCAAVVASACALLLVMRLGRIRRTHSGLVGGMLGPLVVVATVGPALARIEAAWVGLAAALGGGLLLVVTGLAGARVAKRLEGDRPASAGLSWTGASLLLAGLAWNLHGGGTAAAWTAHASIAIGVAFGAMGLLGLAPGGPRAPRTRFGGLLLVLAVGAAVVPFWPWWLPWLLYDRNLPEVASWPPNFLFVALEAPAAPLRADSDSGVASLEVLGVDAVTYSNLAPEPVVGSLFALPDGSLLGTHLHQVGYATAAIGAAPDTFQEMEMGIAEVDDRPGGRRLLEESAAWMAGAPLLLGPTSGLLGLLGHDRPLRGPEQVAGEAAQWILSWRTTRAPAPFFLFVDLRTPMAGAEVLDAGLWRILDRLRELQLDSVTFLVVAVESRASGGSGSALRALVIPPSGWPHVTRLEVPPQVWGRALSQSLLQIALSDGESPVRLWGLNQELLPPKLR